MKVVSKEIGGKKILTLFQLFLFFFLMFTADSALGLGHSFLSPVKCNSSSTHVGHIGYPTIREKEKKKDQKMK